MSQFILPHDRKRSMPSLANPVLVTKTISDTKKLARSPDVENIPAQLLKVPDKSTITETQHQSLQHSQSATVPDNRVKADDKNLGLYVKAQKDYDADLDLIVRQLQIDLGMDPQPLSNFSLTNTTNSSMEFSPAPSPNVSDRPVGFKIEQGTRTSSKLTLTSFPIPFSPTSLSPRIEPPSFNHENNNTAREEKHVESDTGNLDSTHGALQCKSVFTQSATISNTCSKNDVNIACPRILKESSGSRDGFHKNTQLSRAYYIAKELVMTERTYVKDIGVIAVLFRNAFIKSNITLPVIDSLFVLFTQLHQTHRRFLKQIEQRLLLWEGQELKSTNSRDQCRICDLLVSSIIPALAKYEYYMEQVEPFLVNLELASRESSEFEQLYHDWETKKICYLPLNVFLLKPSYRLLHYHLLINKFVEQYDPSTSDHADCLTMKSQLLRVVELLAQHLPRIDNLQKLFELQQDLVGLKTNLLQMNREFIREGCLQKLSRKGYKQRMFFLFSDVLLYTSRMAMQSLLFKVHEQISLDGMTVLELEKKQVAVSNSFIISAGDRSLLVAASSEHEKNKWIGDLRRAIARFSSSTSISPAVPGIEPQLNAIEGALSDFCRHASLKSTSSSEQLPDIVGSDLSLIDRGQIQHRTSTLMHVCWHRNTSVGIKECCLANRLTLSGYLMRMYKTSNEWQRLWIVFTNFCFFFFKSYRDESPLASLPLLRYSIDQPTASENIHNDEFVFKLQFKNHVYLFRAESQFTFERWVDVISTAAEASRQI